MGVPEFIEVHALEFNSNEKENTPVMVRVSEILTFQPMSKRVRADMMKEQGEALDDGSYRGVTEPPVNCCGIMLKRTVHQNQPFYVINLWVEESYEEIKYKLHLTSSSVA